MKTDKTNLMLRVRGLIIFPTLALAILFLYSHTLYSSDSKSVFDKSQEEKITVVGKVIDANNQALDSVIVKDVNSDNETISDVDGNFTLSLNDPTTVSFVKLGYQVKEIEIAESDSNLVVMLTPESNELIVQGFGSEMNGDKNRNWVANSFTSIIDNNPLYIIDNTQKGRDFNIETLNPDDVMSIEVLRDTIAKELYGTDGERGAVSIMTKNFMQTDNKVAEELVEDEVILPNLRERYEMYLDTMNARNERLRQRNNRGLKSRSVMPVQNELPKDSLNKLNKEDLDAILESPEDSTSMKLKSDTLLNEMMDTTATTLKIKEEIQ